MYAFNIEYHHENSHKSGCSGAATTLEQAREGLAYHIKYYSTECPVIIDTAEIVHICTECKGVGEHVKYYKRTSFVQKRTPCTNCDGKGSTLFEVWPIT